MNQTIVIIGTFFSAGLVACGQSNQDITNANPVSSIAKVVDTRNNIDDVHMIMENLKNTTPFSVEQLKSVFPDNINSVKKTSYFVQNVLGAESVETIYKSDQVKYIVKIFDGAGDMGANMAGMRLLDQSINSEYENDNGYKRPTIVHNIKGAETQVGKNSGQTENKITLRINNQVFLDITAIGADMDELKKGIENSQLIENIEKLKH